MSLIAIANQIHLQASQTYSLQIWVFIWVWQEKIWVFMGSFLKNMDFYGSQFSQSSEYQTTFLLCQMTLKHISVWFYHLLFLLYCHFITRQLFTWYYRCFLWFSELVRILKVGYKIIGALIPTMGSNLRFLTLPSVVLKLQPCKVLTLIYSAVLHEQATQLSLDVWYNLILHILWEARVQ